MLEPLPCSPRLRDMPFPRPNPLVLAVRRESGRNLAYPESRHSAALPDPLRPRQQYGMISSIGGCPKPFGIAVLGQS